MRLLTHAARVVTCGLIALAVGSEGTLAGPSFNEKRVVIQSEGWQIIAEFAVPSARSRVPAVIMLNKAAGSRAVYRELAEQLHKRGIATLRVDLRGEGDSTNLGKFVPGQNNEILQYSERDILAAVDFLAKDKRIDAARLAFVGASYSGEEMMEAARARSFGAAYVALSPGSLSDESIAAIDTHKLNFFLIVSRNERHLKAVAQAYREKSRTGEYLEVAGTAHATNILPAHPDLAERIAVWLSHRLTAPTTRAR